MLSAAHTIISLPFGLLFTNPLMAFGGALLMHLFSDTLLHWNIYPHQYKKYPVFLVSIDILSGLIASYAILNTTALSIPVLAAIAGGNAPDVAHALWSFTSSTTKKHAPMWMRSVFQFHEDIQRETQSPLAGGLSQVILCSIAIVLTLVLR